MDSLTTARVHIKLRQRLPRRVRPDIVAQHFLRYALLLVRGRGEQVERPEQRNGRCLVSCDDHRGHLIAELSLREPRAGFRITRGDQQVEQVSGNIEMRRAQAGLHHALDEAHPSRLESPAREIPRSRNGTRQQQVEQIGMRMTFEEAHELGAHLRAVFAHFHREHGAAGNLERQELHGGK